MRLFSIGVKAIVLCAAVAGTLAQAKTPEPPSLYTRLGGYDAIAAVTDDFIGRLATDPQLSRFFMGVSDNSKARIRQLVVDQICAATGGPCVYIGRSMKDAHKGLGITEKDWDISANLLVQSLDKFKVGQKEKDDLLAAVTSMKNEIVDSPEGAKK